MNNKKNKQGARALSQADAACKAVFVSKLATQLTGWFSAIDLVAGEEHAADGVVQAIMRMPESYQRAIWSLIYQRINLRMLNLTAEELQ